MGILCYIFKSVNFKLGGIMDTILVLIIFAGWIYFFLFGTKNINEKKDNTTTGSCKLQRETIIYPIIYPKGYKGYIVIDRRFK
jgi:uncharacterized alpha/beta hydrolase family protein